MILKTVLEHVRVFRVFITSHKWRLNLSLNTLKYLILVAILLRHFYARQRALDTHRKMDTTAPITCLAVFLLAQ